MRILVTGGSGFIGSAVCLRLHERPDTQIINLDAMTYAANPTSLSSIAGSSRYTLEKADIRGLDSVRDAFTRHQPDRVIHLAAETHVDRSIDDPLGFVTTNVQGTANVLASALEHWRGLSGAARKAFRLVHVSTDEVFGSLGPSGAFNEDSAYHPRSPYSASKAGSDHLAAAWGHTYGLPVIISNCANNYGPRQFPEKLIPLTIINILAGNYAAIYGDGSNVRDWLHVDDHAAALEQLCERGRPGRSYAVGARSERTNLEMVTAICDIVDELSPRADEPPRRELIRFVPDRPGHDARYAIDPSRLENELDWKPSRSLEQGLRETVLWYLENDAWWRPLADHYDGRRLGLLEPDAG